MPEAAQYDFEKLAREIVTSRVKGLTDPSQAAADIAKKIIVTGVQSTKVRQDPHLTVSAVCRGIMSGMLLIEHDLSGTAVLILREMADISHEVPLDPTELMTWGMEGIAGVAVLAGRDAQSGIQDAIEHAFMGVGTVFHHICETAAARPQGS